MTLKGTLVKIEEGAKYKGQVYLEKLKKQWKIIFQ